MMHHTGLACLTRDAAERMEATPQGGRDHQTSACTRTCPMTETALPLPPAGPQQPVEPPPPAPKRRISARWVAIGVVIAGLAVAGWVFREPVTWAITSHNQTNGDASAATRSCDSDAVTVRSMALNGVSIDVTAPGPNFVQVDVRNGFGHRRMFQQVTSNDSGASFVMW